MKKFLEEFKAFILRGNVLDLAVAVIIGGAFQKIIASLVDDVIMPIISLITGGIDFNNWFLAFDGKHYETLNAAKAAGVATLNYGTFLTAVINFLIMAFVIFLLVKAMNTLINHTRIKKDAEAAIPQSKICLFCKSEIAIDATRCPHCTSLLEENEKS